MGLRYESFEDMPTAMRYRAAQRMAAEAKAKKYKYHNKPTIAGGVKLDSQKEARRFQQLLDAQREGVIDRLRLQQDFTLQEAYTTVEGERIRAIRYRADFTYRVIWSGETIPSCVSFEDLEYWRKVGKDAFVIEDTKSQATKTDQYRMKYKMMAKQGFTIREV